MKKTLFVLLIFKFSIFFAQEIRYVNTSGGLNIRKEANSNSDKVSKLKCGEKVEVIGKTSKKLSLSENGKIINGVWVKISNGLTIGYVFDGFLSEIKPKLYYSINVLGTKVYSEPSFTSKVKTKYKVGKIFISNKIIETTEKYHIAKGFELRGNWIGIKGMNGFVFSSDLSNKKPSFYESGHISPNALGKKIDKKVIPREFKIEDKKYIINDNITIYENGTHLTNSFDGCFDDIYTIKNVTLAEVYHQLISQNLSIGESEIWAPKFHKKENNEILFIGEGATQDLKIIIKIDGSFIISSYSCT